MTIFDPQLAERIAQCGHIAVLVIDDAEDAVPLARALADGGVDILELTLRTPAALEAIRRVTAAIPAMVVGAGTVLSPEQVLQAQQAGAMFAVAPGLNPRVLEAAVEHGLSFAPGIMTPSDIEAALERGCRLLKFFPAESIGGIRTLQAMAAPYAHLQPRFIPLGGLTAENSAAYLRCSRVAACGGSWMAPRDAIRSGDWSRIRGLAETARAIAQAARRDAGNPPLG